MSLGRPDVTKSEAVQIRVITKKLHLGPKHMHQLEVAKREGVDGVTALANVLGLKPGQDPKEFIAKRLSEREYNILAGILDLAKDGNPLR